MPVLDLAANITTAYAEISGSVSLRRTGGEEPLIQASFELAFDVGDGDAEILNGFVPGASDLWARSRVEEDSDAAEALDGAAAASEAGSVKQGTFGEIKVRIPHTDYRFAFVGDDDEAVVFDVELRTARLKAAPKATKFLVRLRGDVTPDVAAAFAALVEFASLKVTAQRTGQLTIQYGRPSVVPETGHISSGVHDGIEYAGIVVGTVNDEDVGQCAEIDDFGQSYIVPLATIAGTINVGDYSDAIQTYRALAEKADAEMSWRFLVPALGQFYLAEGAPDGPWVLTVDVVAAAVEAARIRQSA